MQKYIKIIAIFLTSIFIFTSCTNKNKIVETNESVIDKKVKSEIEVFVDTGKDYPTFGSYEDAEELKSVEEDASLLKEKKEFMQLFKKFCGFSLPEYFFIPKVTDETNWNRVFISERFMGLIVHFIVKKNDALEIIKLLKEDETWRKGYDLGIIHDVTALTQEEIEVSTYFEKSRDYDESWGEHYVYMHFQDDIDNDFYILEMNATLERDPPPGTSWPELHYH